MTIDLDAIEARANAATPGPWDYRYGVVRSPQTDVASLFTQNQADGELMAAARSDIPALLAEVRSLQAERDTLRGELDRIYAVASSGGMVAEVDHGSNPVETKVIRARLRAACIVRAERAEREAENLRGELAEANCNADLRGAQLLMVGSELCGDPKIDPADLGDPRNTPTLREAARMRAELDRVRSLPKKWRKRASRPGAASCDADMASERERVLAKELDAALRGKDGGE